MKILITILSVFFIFSCNQSNDSSFKLDSSKAVEVGIVSIEENTSGMHIIQVYMINHQPVSGVQFKIDPNTFWINKKN